MSFAKFKPVLLELSMKVSAAIGISWFAVRIWNAYQISPNLVYLLMFAAELLTVTLVIFSKPTDTRNFSPIPVIVTVCATFYFFAIYLDNGQKLISDHISSLIIAAAILWQIYAKIYLGRSFGLLPACRKIVDTGPYRIVRHPIYLGYFIAHMAFLLNNFSFWNVKVITLLYLLQFCRMNYEEKTLSQNVQYREYQKKVKYRFIPFIF